MKSIRQCRALVFILVPLSITGQNLPVGTTLEVRLSTPTGSRISCVGEQVKGITIAPIAVGGQILIPPGSRLNGSVESVKPLGLGLKQITASIHYRFDTLQLPDGDPIPIHTELLEVETAKERVDVDGTVRGIHPAASLSSSLALFTVPLLFIAPAVGMPVWAIKSAVAPSANPEIYFPPGTELILRFTAPIELRTTVEKSVGVRSFSPSEVRNIHQLLNGTPQRARLGKHRSDLVNILFFGTREEMDRAFHAAGWSRAERKSPLSLYRMYHALTKRIGYRRAPMNTLTLNGVPSAFAYQKSLDTVQKRHHVRLWKAAHGSDAWLGAAAEDIAFRFEFAHWTHSTSPEIDDERAKVVNDLAFTGCLDAAALVTRDSRDLLQDGKGGRLILTDTDIAVVQLNDCTHPRTMVGVDAISNANRRSRLSRCLASLRNDLRLNIFFTTYNTLMLATKGRTLTPLRKDPDTDSNPPGLGWLTKPAEASPEPAPRLKQTR